MGRPNPEIPEIKIKENDNSASLEQLKQELHQGSPIDRPEGSQQSEALKETRVSLQANTKEVRAQARDLLIQNQAGNLSIPLFTSIFYISDPSSPADESKPYYGPVHYHGEENPADDGYIGWMAGHNQPGAMGPKLNPRTIRNYKVVSAIHSLLPNQDVFSISSMSGINENSTGNRLERFLNYFMNFSRLLLFRIRLCTAMIWKLAKEHFLATTHMSVFV